MLPPRWLVAAWRLFLLYAKGLQVSVGRLLLRLYTQWKRLFDANRRKPDKGGDDGELASSSAQAYPPFEVISVSIGSAVPSIAASNGGAPMKDKDITEGQTFFSTGYSII